MLAFFHAVILVFIIEGCLLTLFPGHVRRALVLLFLATDSGLRIIGVLLLLAGLFGGLLVQWLQ